MTKDEVRAVAARHGLAVAKKPESQDLCFLAGQGKTGFLRRHGNLVDREGAVVDRAGRTLGRHRGHHNFTVGQRRGIGVSLNEPGYVIATDAAANTVTVGTREDLETRRIHVRDAVLHRDGARVDNVRLRYHSDTLPATVGAAAPGRHKALELRARRALRRRRAGPDRGADGRRDDRRPRHDRRRGLSRRPPARPPRRAAQRPTIRPQHSLHELSANRRLSLMKAQQIRDTYLAFFAERGHKVVPSASLVPSVLDPTVLLTTAGMQPFKPYFLGRETPPAPRLTDVQKCFRTTDIEEVGNTARHMTFFEMLGNWSFGDYFKAESIPWGWQLATEGFGMDPERIWVTVFGGDEELGLGPDTEAIEIWEATGVPRERIVELGREDNFWQGGPTGPCGPCSELYLDRGLDFGTADERPGDEGERFLEFWNHVFMSYDLHEDGSLTELPMKNIDTGMGLDRMAAILQDVPSVFDVDHVRPLIDLAEELSGHAYDESEAVTRAMRIVADHSRGAAFLIADGVVPSNEDRGYILRRIMRRAIQQGNTLGLEAPWLGRFAERVIELMGEAYPELVAERENDRPLGERRGGELRAHAGARRRSCSSGWSPRRARPAPPGSTRPTPSNCTTPTASPTT